MTPIILICTIAVLCVLVLLLISRLSTKSHKVAQPYVLKPSLFSPAERSFLGCLDTVLPPNFRVFAKVRLADIYNVQKTPDRSAWQSAQNKISGKHVDFLLCRVTDLSPVLAIELDDATHEREDRRKRDLFLDEIFAASNLPLLRFKVQKAYRTEDIVRRLNEAMK